MAPQNSDEPIAAHQEAKAGKARRPEPLARREPMPRKGEVLILAGDLSLVLGLRQELMLLGYDLTWTNNFWVAMSYLHTRTFASLV